MNMINRNRIRDYLERIEENIDNALNELDPDDFDMLMEDVKDYIKQFDD